MVTLDTFNKNISSLLYFAEVPIDEVKNKFLYNLIKNDFEDKEFGDICIDICKTEDLYGRYPAPKLFYDRKAHKANTVLIKEGSFFIDSGDGYLPMFKDKIDSMSEESKERCLLWLLNNRGGEEVELDFIKKIIDKFYKPKYAEREIDYDDDVRGLLSGSVKRLTFDEDE